MSDYKSRLYYATKGVITAERRKILVDYFKKEIVNGKKYFKSKDIGKATGCLLYTSPSPRD